MDISVIVPTLRRDDVLEQTLKDLLDQEGGTSYELLVVDQNPEPVATRHAGLAKLAADARIRWIECVGRGVVYARNLACSQALGELLVFVDDDVRVEDKEFLRKHRDAHTNDEYQLAAICGCELNRNARECSSQLIYERRDPIDDILFFPRNHDTRIEACVLSTCNCSIKTAAFIAVGGFDERFRGASYGDDSDLALRLVEAGYRIVYDPVPYLLHLMWPMGGLRMADKTQRFRERDKYIASLFFYYKHRARIIPSHRWFYLYNYVLRKSVMLRRNVLQPWRIPVVVKGLIEARRVAKELLIKGHEFSFDCGSTP